MFKKILIFSILTVFIIGCKSNEKLEFDNANTNKGKIIYSAEFNQEHYIWENWSFSTNRVNK